MTQPSLTLNTGVDMPALGLGVFRSGPYETITAVRAAIDTGYRLIDTAVAYRNERQVGEAIRASGIARSQLFVTSKLWVTQYGYDEALRAFDESLGRLGFDSLDLYLLHWPVPSAFDRTVAAYRALERLLAEKRVRAIGVCNFSPSHLQRLAAETDIVPAVNQIELHPFFTQAELRAVDRQAGIVTQSWSPIGGVILRNQPAAGGEAPGPLAHPVIRDIAAGHGRTPAQIVIAWHLRLGLSVIPKSVNPARIAENFDVFDIALSPQEVAAIDALDTGARAGRDPDTATAEVFGLDISDQ